MSSRPSEAPAADDALDHGPPPGVAERLLAMLPYSVYAFDTERRVVYANPAHFAIIGRRAEEAIGHRLTEIGFGAIGAHLDAQIASVLASGEPLHDEIRWTPPGGAEEAYSYCFLPTREHGVLTGVSGYSTNLAGQRQREEELARLSEDLETQARFFDTTLSSINDLAYTFDLEGRWTYANKPLLELWGRSLEEIRGKTSWELDYPHDLAQRLKEQVQEVVATRKPLKGETFFTSGSGVVDYHEYIFSPVFGADGAVVGVCGTTRLITERKRMEEMLRESNERLESRVQERTQALRETVADLETFSYSISHDLRAPLRAMQSFATILAEEHGEAVGPDGRDYIARIARSAARMDRLVEDILVYSRVSRAELPLGPVDVDVLLDGILESYPQFDPGAADIEVRGPLPMVLANEAALAQCLSNLLGNAIKYVRPGERPRLVVWSEDRPGMARLLVRDNGIGIEHAHHERIFEVFQQLERRPDGTGIGLAIVRKAMERMGGSVGLDSAPGKGSTFWLDLRRVDA
jgi:PAS domain S-box-containing protein